MGIKFANFATSTIANVGGIGAGDLSLDVQPGDGALFPTLVAGDYFYAVLVSSGGTREIVKVTARSTDTFTIERAQEGTSAAVFAAGSAVELRITADSLSLIEDTTSTAAELSTLHSSGITNADLVKVHAITASAAEVNDALDGNTSTAAELSTLHSSGITNADLVKVHAITKTAAQVNSHMPAVASMHATNAGSVTFGVAGDTICAIVVGNVSIGDIILVTGNMYAEKLGTSGDTRARITNTGTATVNMGSNEYVMGVDSDISAAQPAYINLTNIYTVTGAGTFGLTLTGYSDGSNSICDAGYGGLHAVFLVKS